MGEGDRRSAPGDRAADAGTVGFDDLIPRWLFCVRTPGGQAATAVLVPLALGAPMLLASDGSDLRFGPLLALAAIIVAATTSSRATVLAGALILTAYWWWGVPLTRSFRLTSAGNLGSILAMAVLVVGLVALTRRIELTVEQVRALDGQRRRDLRELQLAFAERDRIARTLSTSLIPTVLADLPGLASAHWLEAASADQVAGDFYDLFSVGDGDWVAVLGDVSGKGAEAAAVTSLARYAARTAALSRPDPISVVDTVDRALTADSSDLFCTLVVVRWCSAESQVQVALAGHHPIRLITADGVRRVGRFGSAAGLGIGTFRLDAATVAPGDTLLLFSDGLVERNPTLGEDALDELLARAPRSPEQLVAHLQRTIAQLEPVHTDDIAVLALRRTP